MGTDLKADFAQPEKLDQLRRLLKTTARILQGNNISYWLDHGVLLGAYRSAALIPGDDDIDLGVLHKDWPMIQRVLEAELPDDMSVTTLHHGDIINPADSVHDTPWFSNAHGTYAVAHNEHWDGRRRLHSATALAVHYADTRWNEKPNLDLYCYRENSIHDCMPDHTAAPWLSDGKSYLCLPSRNAWSQATPRELIFPLSMMKLEGVVYPAPCQTRKFLQRIYGYTGSDAVFDESTRRWVKDNSNSDL